MASPKDLLVSADALKSMVVARATGDTADRDADYQRQRETLLKAPPAVRAKVPTFVRTCRTLFEFWGFIKPKFGSYQERRDYLRAEFDRNRTATAVVTS